MTSKNEIIVIAPINIALIKYWGKRDVENIIPLNDSISVNIDSVYAKTTLSIRIRDDEQISSDTVVVNGKAIDLQKSPRFSQCFSRVRELAAGKLPDGAVFNVDSVTNFPTSAGLASSAAGFAAIAFGLGKLLDLDTDTISGLARKGSGSACRSIYGGFVHWIAGESANGSDCLCRQLSPIDTWPSLRAIVVVVSSRAKREGSTDAMQRSVETSQLLRHRLALIPERVRLLKQSIATKDFASFAEIVMKDSNQLHAICADTYPPLFFVSDTSCYLIELVHAFNEFQNQTKVAYTFDAGPNCCLLMEEQTVKEFLPYLCYYLPNRKADKFIRGATVPEIDRNVRPFSSSTTTTDPEPVVRKTDRLDRLTPLPDSVEYVIVSKVGSAPYVLER